MKTNFNQNSRPGVVAAIAVIISLVSFPVSEAFAPLKSLAPVIPVMITLQPGVSGSEIQQALDSLPDRGGEVILPPGDISIRQPIVLCRDSQTLRGSGTATVLRLADNANCPVIIMGEPVNDPKQTVKNLRVCDLVIDGNRAHQQRELWKLDAARSATTGSPCRASAIQ